MSKKFLNLHILYTFAGANPNRDDAGSPKSLIYGGRERSRMSSQAMTRAKRSGYENDPAGEKAFRSNAHARYLTQQVIASATAQGANVTDAMIEDIFFSINHTITTLTAKVEGDRDKAKSAAVNKSAAKAAKKKATDGHTSDDSNDGPKDTVTILSEEESQRLVDAAVERIIAGTPAKAIEVSDFISGPQTTSLSIAAYGRMFAVRNDLACEAAVQRSNAFTTHEATLEIDYFSVLDDLKHTDDTADRGAAHLGLKQLTGGVYYWHANIDKEQLLANLSEGFDLNDGRAAAFFRHLLNDLPQGMDKITATAQLVPFVLMVESDSPVSFQSAFENPVQADSSGYLAPSVERLVSAYQRNSAFDADQFGDAMVSGVDMGLAGAALPEMNLSALSDYFARWVKS